MYKYKNDIILFLTGLLLCSCALREMPNVNNPVEVQTQAGKFTVNVFEEEPGIIPDSVYRFRAVLSEDCLDGRLVFTGAGSRGSSKEFEVFPDTVELVLTPWNRICFETDLEVNASSGTDVLDIVREDMRHYSISASPAGPGAIREGRSVIRFWNGNGEHSVSVAVRAANSIPCEGVEVRLDGGPSFFLVGTQSASFESIPSEEVTFLGIYSDYCAGSLPDIMLKGGKAVDSAESADECWMMDKASVLELVGTVPRNATPDNRIMQIYDMVDYDNDYPAGSVYLWNAGHYDGFRWMPPVSRYVERTGMFSYFPPEGGKDPKPLTGTMKRPFYPADLRYRKAMVWNHGNTRMPQYIGYQVGSEGNEKYFWCFLLGLK